jgi:SAM-dependent methyltransferase
VAAADIAIRPGRSCTGGFSGARNRRYLGGRREADLSIEGPLAHLKEHPELIDADLREVARLVPAGAALLDIGAGRGSFVEAAARRGFRAVALDLQPEAAGVWRQARLAGVVADGGMAPFRAAEFDLVRMKEVIEHVAAPLALVREARRILKPGGIIFAHVPTPYSQLYPVGNFWDDYTHVRPFSRLGLTRLFTDAGLELVRIDAYTAGRNPLERAAGKVLGRLLPHIYRVIARNPVQAEAERG